VTLPAAPGDVLAVASGPPWVRRLIRLGGLLEGKPAPVNHVIGITHQDGLGRWIGIQGQPGGVGLVDATPYLSDPRTRSNHGQPKPDDRGQLAYLLASAAKTIGVAYDWVGIAEDTARALRAVSLAALINKLYAWPAGHGKLPGDVVCSSLWAALYGLAEVGYAHPDAGRERACTPASWWIWNDRQQWKTG
jgi:hypothetical protein